MKTILIIILTSVVTSGFTQDYYFSPKYSTTLDESKGELLLSQCSRWTPEDISGYWTPAQNDVHEIEQIFKKVYGLRTTNGQTIASLDKFAFQYVGVTIKRKRFIYINAFHLDNDAEFVTFYKNWKTEPVVMCDGGDFYWGVLFSVDKSKFKDLAINGV